jgi:hypothetical protein
MLSHRRIGALLLVCGYLGVVAGTVSLIISDWRIEPFRPETTMFQVALAMGIGLAGFACWRWTVNGRGSDANSHLVRGPTRWMAAAALVLAAAPAAQTYETYDDHRQLVRNAHQALVEYPHYRLLIAGGTVFAAGLVLAAIGFWILGSTSEMTAGSPGQTIGSESPPAVVTQVEPVP